MKQKREIKIDPLYDVAVAILAMRNHVDYSVIIEEVLTKDKKINNEIERIKKLPEVPPMIKGDIKEFLQRTRLRKNEQNKSN